MSLTARSITLDRGNLKGGCLGYHVFRPFDWTIMLVIASNNMRTWHPQPPLLTFLHWYGSYCKGFILLLLQTNSFSQRPLVFHMKCMSYSKWMWSQRVNIITQNCSWCHNAFIKHIDINICSLFLHISNPWNSLWFLLIYVYYIGYVRSFYTNVLNI